MKHPLFASIVVGVLVGILWTILDRLWGNPPRFLHTAFAASVGSYWSFLWAQK